MKTLMCKVNGKQKQYGVLKDISAVEFPYYLAILANKYNAYAILDAEALDLNIEETVAKVVSLSPEKLVILACGSHPSAYIQQIDIMKQVKEDLRYYCETELLYSLPEGIQFMGEPRWDLLDMSLYRCHNWHAMSGTNKWYGVVATSMGCPMKCSFCTIKNFLNLDFYQFPLERVFSEFDEMNKRGISNIKLMDELFVFNKKRVFDICNYIIEKNYRFNIWAYARIDIMDKETLDIMKKAGINWLAYGIESGNEEIRKLVSKGNFSNEKIEEIVKLTKDCGISVVGNYMFGFWEDTLETMKETYDLAVRLNCEYSNFYCVTAYPDTPLYNEMLDKGIELPKDTSEYSQMSKDFKCLPTKTLNANEVLKFRDEAFNKYYRNMSYLMNINTKFGDKGIKEINTMLSYKLERN